VPRLELDSGLQDLLERANRSLGRLDGVGMLLPDIELLLYFYVRKEALLSSQIEGTQSSLSDLLLFEDLQLTRVAAEDVREVSNYVAAQEHGLRRLAGGFPMSLRLLREMHKILLRSGRGSGKDPGEFRRSQNWLGGTRPGNAAYVPPPPDELLACLDPFEKFLHDEPARTPALIKAALAHVQFESIHPFLDGNGRLGRLLITLMLCSEGAVEAPLLYLSLYFKNHRRTYYDLLQGVRETGEWEAWLDFFLTGVIETSGNAVTAARRILELVRTDREKIAAAGRIAGSALRVHDDLQRHPIVAIPELAARLKISKPTIARDVELLAALGLLKETTGRKRNRLFLYVDYLAILSEGTEPLSPP